MRRRRCSWGCCGRCAAERGGLHDWRVIAGFGPYEGRWVPLCRDHFDRLEALAVLLVTGRSRSGLA